MDLLMVYSSRFLQTCPLALLCQQVPEHADAWEGGQKNMASRATKIYTQVKGLLL